MTVTAADAVVAEQDDELHEMLLRLRSLDEERLVVRLAASDIKLLRSEWLVAQPDGFRMPRRQALEELQRELEAKGEALTPFLSAEEAVALVRRGDRGAGVLSHGWLCPGNCDPCGKRVAVVQRALRLHPHIAGLFWECAASLVAMTTRARISPCV